MSRPRVEDFTRLAMWKITQWAFPKIGISDDVIWSNGDYRLTPVDENPNTGATVCWWPVGGQRHEQKAGLLTNICHWCGMTNLDQPTDWPAHYEGPVFTLVRDGEGWVDICVSCETLGLNRDPRIAARAPAATSTTEAGREPSDDGHSPVLHLA